MNDEGAEYNSQQQHPFEKGQYRYTFKNVCDEESNLELGDETYKLFFNTAGTKGDISDDLRELLHYMNSVADFPIDKTDNELIHKIDRAVDIAKQSDEWRRAHMNYLLQQRDAEKRGEAKGRAEGMVTGENRLSKLINIFIGNKEYDKVALATSDAYARETFYRQYGIT